MDGNRPNQETFRCVECGHSDNADHNAAVNIGNRVSVAVLRNSLLKQLGNGAYEPKRLKRDKVKEVLLSFRGSLTGKSDSECSESINLNALTMFSSSDNKKGALIYRAFFMPVRQKKWRAFHPTRRTSVLPKRSGSEIPKSASLM